MIRKAFARIPFVFNYMAIYALFILLIVAIAGRIREGQSERRRDMFSARCEDGSYSFSVGQGTCSHHGGVAEWLR